MLEYYVDASRIDSHGGIARRKGATAILDTDMTGQRDAFSRDNAIVAN
jgi:hypothetical protein